jgi:Asp-tRNA(Asn)/Glu-tRNA(Gln) amidotransferase A subunit family amidase
MATTFGSHARRGRIARRSGEVHRAFHDSGAVLVGKSNLSDLALTPETESWVGGVSVHPEDATRTPGGSSGGAAAAVASGMAAFDWGSDFGGSIRLPAALCGVVGLRLSRARWPVPDEGGHAPSDAERLFDGMGPIARDLSTCEAALHAAAPRLRRGAAAPTPAFAGLLVLGPDAKTRGAWPGFVEEISRHASARAIPTWPAPLPTVSAMDRAYVRLLASLSAPIDLSGLGAIVSALSLGPLLGDRRLHPRSAEVLAKLALLRLVRGRDGAAALRAVTALRARVEGLLDAGFVIVSPTTTHPAPRRGTALRIPGLASFVKVGNLADATALSMPFGRFEEPRLPRGLQLMGPAGSEHHLLDLAARLD